MKMPTINLRHQIQMLCWGFLFMGIIGYWSFQHLLILNSYSYLGVSNLTIVCLLIIATLLPYSLARRCRLANEWYALAFCPSMLGLSVIANQHIGAATIITAALALTVCIVLAVKQPALRCHPVNSNLTILIVVSIISLCITDTDELTHNRNKLQHLVAAGKYEDALRVGTSSTATDSSVFNLRATALNHIHQLGSRLFNYPVPQSNSNIAISSAPRLSAADTRDITLCNLLLSKDLSTFSKVLPQLYNISSDTLPLHYKEALVIYMSRSTNPSLSYANTLIETNYADFMAEKKKYPTASESKSKCYNLYGGTYFWYYHFHQLSK